MCMANSDHSVEVLKAKKVKENTKKELFCAVCEDSASGVHYNVPACFGCKTFFRRAVIKSRRYFCEQENGCNVSQRSGRRSCRACRLRKCFDVGMNQTALQPKRDHNYSNQPPFMVSASSLPSSSTIASSSKPFSSQFSFSSMPSTSRQNSSSITTLFNQIPSTSKSTGTNNNWLKIMEELTVIDRTLREQKKARLRCVGEGLKLAREVNNTTYPEYYGRSDLRIVEGMDMASVTSCELYSLLEWAKTLPFFNKLPLKTRTEILQKFSVYHNVIEQGEYTAKSGLNNLWLLPNGTCLPKDVNELPTQSRLIISEERAWRQDKLYKRWTERCIDDVAMPMRRLQLLPEELVTLKIIMLCQCGLQVNAKSTDSLLLLRNYKDDIIRALFEFYRNSNLPQYEERFGNILLLTSGIVSAGACTLENYRIHSIFNIVPFDKMSLSLLFPQENNADLQL